VPCAAFPGQGGLFFAILYRIILVFPCKISRGLPRGSIMGVKGRVCQRPLFRSRPVFPCGRWGWVGMVHKPLWDGRLDRRRWRGGFTRGRWSGRRWTPGWRVAGRKGVFQGLFDRISAGGGRNDSGHGRLRMDGTSFTVLPSPRPSSTLSPKGWPVVRMQVQSGQSQRWCHGPSSLLSALCPS
jgi:hypothetical protein